MNLPNPKDFKEEAGKQNREKELQLLDHFAGLAMQTLIADDSFFTNNSDTAIATASYIIAGAMLQERKKRLNN